jgi:hypothetical protein
MKLNIFASALLLSAFSFSATVVSASVRSVFICFCCYCCCGSGGGGAHDALCVPIRIRCAHVLPTHTKHITQTIRGVAITSDSVDSSTDYSQVKATLDEDNILATNLWD